MLTKYGHCACNIVLAFTVSDWCDAARTIVKSWNWQFLEVILLSKSLNRCMTRSDAHRLVSGVLNLSCRYLIFTNLVYQNDISFLEVIPSDVWYIVNYLNIVLLSLSLFPLNILAHSAMCWQSCGVIIELIVKTGLWSLSIHTWRFFIFQWCHQAAK